MNQSKQIRMGSGVLVVYLFLSGILFQLTVNQERVQANRGGQGNSDLHLPFVMNPLRIPITRVSIASDGTQANDESYSAFISADAQYVTFYSYANNLVSADTNGTADVFFYDRYTGQISRVSVASDGTQGNRESGDSSISANGRYVVFSSNASNLVSGDTNSARDVFVHDRQTGQTSRVSVSSDGIQANRYSLLSVISADGRYVAFQSYATNLVSGDTNGTWDIFVHDRQTGQTSLVSVASDGTHGNGYSSFASISADGRYVAFSSASNNLVSGDTNNFWDIFVHDRQTGQTTRISMAPDGTATYGDSHWPAISADGRYVSFTSEASNLVSGDTNDVRDSFVFDRQTMKTRRISVASDGTQGNGACYIASISADGRYVAFPSYASNLVSGDNNYTLDIFVYDQQTEQISRVSVASNGTEGNGGSFGASISADGRYVAFESEANNLISGDTNGVLDIFVYDRDE